MFEGSILLYIGGTQCFRAVDNFYTEKHAVFLVHRYFFY